MEQVTSDDGTFSFAINSSENKTLQLNKEGYVFEDLRNLAPATNLNISLRTKKISSATLRWQNYLTSCAAYNSPNIPEEPTWDVEFTETDLTGDFAANATYTRRDPSAVIEHNGMYYVWYTYKLSETSTYFGTSNVNDNVFPWDHADIYYASSPDGYQWTEQGAAVSRGPSGSYDDRSAFTPEIFVHQGKFYLIYQAVKHPYIERVKNTVAMAVADTPNGPWTKLDEPILRPTDNGIWQDGSTSRFDVIEKGDFDSHKVHDPCLRFYKDKFYLYYKGERMGEEKFCGEREIRWGVAIADQPTGPYVKSEYNPITTTGHEVSVWNYDDGIAIIQKLDGPEVGSIQYATDGINFEMMGKATHVPDALGIFRPASEGNSPRSGVSWGLCHVLRWDQIQGGWMFLKRFDLVNPPTDTNGLVIEAEDFLNTGTDGTLTPGGFDGVNATATGVNYVNTLDWMEFDVTFPEDGAYELTYFISTPNDNTAVQMLIDGQVIANNTVTNNGEWEEFYPLKNPDLIVIDAGTYRIRVVANGSNDWQWNMDKFQFVKDDSGTLGVESEELDALTVFPNPANSLISIPNIKKSTNYSIYNIQGIAVGNGIIKPGSPSIQISSLPKGAYILTLKDDGNKEKSTMIIKK
ncbi:carbohydrate-binding protein [Aquimarina sp. RZ0]|nr:carbohydrate-binding protein [Aquimarina sp. RZ0]